MIAQRMKIILLILMTGCTNNWGFYSPTNHQESIKYTASPHEIREFTVPTENGHQLNAQYHSSKQQSKNGLVVHFHGNKDNISITLDKVDWLLEQGFDLLVFDYSGYGKSTGQPTPETTFKDARAILAFLAHQTKPHAEYKKIVWGTSLGGAILISGLAEPKYPIQVDLIIIDASFYQYSDMANYVLSQHLILSFLKVTTHLIIDDSYSAKGRVKQLPKAPLLISHCVNDELIPIAFSRQIYDEAQGIKAFWPLENCRHARSFANENKHYQQLLLKVLLNPSQLSTATQAMKKPP